MPLVLVTSSESQTYGRWGETSTEPVPSEIEVLSLTRKGGRISA